MADSINTTNTTTTTTNNNNNNITDNNNDNNLYNNNEHNITDAYISIIIRGPRSTVRMVLLRTSTIIGNHGIE